MNKYPEWHFCAGDDGRHLFVVELLEIKDFPFLIFNCSLNMDFYSYPGIQYQIDTMTWIGTSEEERYDCVYIFFYLAKMIRNVEERFFKPEQLDALGRYISYLDKSNYRAEHNNINEFTPFSENFNNYFFRALKYRFRGYDTHESTIEVDKECFESLIANNGELQEAYIDVYSPNAKFELFVVETGSQDYEFYFMSEKKEILLIFYKKCS